MASYNLILEGSFFAWNIINLVTVIKDIDTEGIFLNIDQCPTTLDIVQDSNTLQKSFAGGAIRVTGRLSYGEFVLLFDKGNVFLFHLTISYIH